MKSAKFIFSFVVVIALIIFGYYAINNRQYPAATVNRSIVAMNDFQTVYQSALSFYQKEAQALGEEERAQSEEFKNEIKKASLLKLIESKLIHQELYKNNSEEKAEVDELIQQIESQRSEKTDQALQELFNLNWQEFEKVIIIPEAEKKLLIQKLEALGLSLDSWLESKKSEAKIEIFIPGFYWTGRTVDF